MMREVVAAKPDSARAHYVLAEILAHERKFGEAREHASRARTLDPAVKFTDPAKFSNFEQLLQRQQGNAATAQVPAAVSPAAPPARAAPVERSDSGGVPVWLLVVGVVIFIALAMRFMRNRTAAAPQPAYAGGAGYGAAPGGYGYGGVPPAAGSGGPGLMGVGLAAAGGVAAGMLAERLLHGDHDERSLPRDSGGAGGLVPGSFGGDAGSSSAADELTQRGIDFGSGDGWDSGSSSDGGGDFSGGSSDGW
jgi:hypothetical protein